MALITVDKLAIGYEGHTMVDDISFCVSKGDYLSLIGDNGAGKSTLLKTLLSLQKPLSGTITLGEGLKPTDIGYLPQARDIQKDFPASVYEIVMSGCQNKCGLRPFYNKTEQALALSCLDRLGIKNLKNQCFRELSGGQQQRVLLARALCSSKKLIALDEAVAGLDPETTIELYDIIYRLNKEENLTIIMVSHDISATKKYSSHILKIQNGKAFMQTNGGQDGNI